MSSIVLNPTSTPSSGLTHGSLHPVKLRSNTVRCEQYLHHLVLLVRPSILYVVFVHIDQWMHSLESMHPWENYTPLWHCGQNRSTVSPLQWPTQMVHVHSCTWQHYVTWKGPRAVCRWNIFLSRIPWWDWSRPITENNATLEPLFNSPDPSSPRENIILAWHRPWTSYIIFQQKLQCMIFQLSLRRVFCPRMSKLVHNPAMFVDPVAVSIYRLEFSFLMDTELEC